MADGEFGGAMEIGRLDRFEDTAMSVMRLLRMEIGLIEHGDEDGSGRQVAQRFDDDVVSSDFGDADVKIAHQAGQALAVAFGNRRLLLIEMIGEDGDAFRADAGKIAQSPYSMMRRAS